MYPWIKWQNVRCTLSQPQPQSTFSLWLTLFFLCDCSKIECCLCVLLDKLYTNFLVESWIYNFCDTMRTDKLSLKYLSSCCFIMPTCLGSSKLFFVCSEILYCFPLVCEWGPYDYIICKHYCFGICNLQYAWKVTDICIE